MINPVNRIIKAFVTAIKSVTNEVYTFPPPNNPDLYVQIGTVTTNEKGCKDLFGSDCTIDIQVISNQQGSYQTPTEAEDLTDAILASLLPLTTTVLEIDDLKMSYLYLDNSFNDQGLFETDRTYRHIMQFRLLVEEITTASPCQDWILFNGTWNDSKVWSDECAWVD